MPAAIDTTRRDHATTRWWPDYLMWSHKCCQWCLRGISPVCRRTCINGESSQRNIPGTPLFCFKGNHHPPSSIPFCAHFSPKGRLIPLLLSIFKNHSKCDFALACVIAISSSYVAFTELRVGINFQRLSLLLSIRSGILVRHKAIGWSDCQSYGNHRSHYY